MFRNSLIKGHLRQRFHATPRDGSPPFDGVLVECDAEFYKFEAVRVNGHQAASPLLIERSNVSYLQAMAVTPPTVTHAAS